MTTSTKSTVQKAWIVKKAANFQALPSGHKKEKKKLVIVNVRFKKHFTYKIKTFMFCCDLKLDLPVCIIGSLLNIHL